MKKFIILLSLTALFVVQKAEAQTPIDFLSQYSKNLDTIFTGFLTKVLTPASRPSDAKNIIEIQFTATKISGTVGGTVTVQASLDGVDWYTWQGTAAYTLTDATQTTSFKITNHGAKYIRILAVGTGTMSAQIKAKYVARTVATTRM